jgi:hypothetical protein
MDSFDPGEGILALSFPSSRIPDPSLYLSGNVLEGNRKATANNWKGTGFYFDQSLIPAPQPFSAPTVSTTNASQAYTDVLNNAGATRPNRDSVDERIVLNVRTGTGRIIESPEDIPACCKTDQ